MAKSPVVKVKVTPSFDLSDFRMRGQISLELKRLTKNKSLSSIQQGLRSNQSFEVDIREDKIPDLKAVTYGRTTVFSVERV